MRTVYSVCSMCVFVCVYVYMCGGLTKILRICTNAQWMFSIKWVLLLKIVQHAVDSVLWLFFSFPDIFDDGNVCGLINCSLHRFKVPEKKERKINGYTTIITFSILICIETWVLSSEIAYYLSKCLKAYQLIPTDASTVCSFS